MLSLRIDTFEDDSDFPVLSHVFYGDTREYIEGIVKAHAETDSFFRASITTHRFQGMKLTNIYDWKS